MTFFEALPMLKTLLLCSIASPMAVLSPAIPTSKNCMTYFSAFVSYVSGTEAKAYVPKTTTPILSLNRLSIKSLSIDTTTSNFRSSFFSALKPLSPIEPLESKAKTKSLPFLLFGDFCS